MNKIISSVGLPVVYEAGDIFKSKNGSYFILACLGDKYAAITLEDGNRWIQPQTQTHDAVDGLIFVGRNLKITMDNH